MATGFDPQSLVQNSTLAQQAKSIFSGAGQTFDKLTNAVGGAVSGLASSLGQAGLPSASALLTSISQLSASTPISKFTDSLSNTTRIDDLTPQESKPDPSQQGSLQFPSDITDKFIRFTFASYYQPGPLFKREIIPSRSIILPIPADLIEKHGVQYSEKQLGVLGVLQESGMLGSAAAGLQNLTTESAGKAGEALGRLAGDAGNAAAIARNVIGAISDSAGNAFDRATGTILNPYNALQFTGIELRNHSFKYKFSPNNATESQTLKNIIKEFKLRMLPEKVGLLFNFPDVCTIEFSDRENALYYFKNCYLKSISVNYAPSGNPAFFIGGKNPVEVEISLEFGEIEPVTRNDIIKGDFTGSLGSAISSDRQTSQQADSAV